MSIKQAIILAAGYGTRMGEIGKSLPKVMWPLFEYSLLEGQILFARSLGVERIYINTHHQAEKINVREEVSDGVEVYFCHEEKLLGSGGGVHNMINTTNMRLEEPVLVLNSDLFYMIDQKSLEEACELLINEKESPCCLFPVSCESDGSYNLLELKGKYLKNIVPKDQKSSSKITYSGISLILPSRLSPTLGESAFFTTVANFKEFNIPVFENRNWEYWDFGTYPQFYTNLKKVLGSYDQASSTFIKFLEAQKIILPGELKSEARSYRSANKNEITLLEGDFIIQENKMSYRGIEQEL